MKFDAQHIFLLCLLAVSSSSTAILPFFPVGSRAYIIVFAIVSGVGGVLALFKTSPADEKKLDNAKTAAAVASKLAGGVLFLCLTLSGLILSALVAACLTPTEAKIVQSGGVLVQCVTGELLKGDDTFEGIAEACGATAVEEVVGIVETLATSSSDAGSTPVSTAAKAAHHRKASR